MKQTRIKTFSSLDEKKIKYLTGACCEKIIYEDGQNRFLLKTVPISELDVNENDHSMTDTDLNSE